MAEARGVEPPRPLSEPVPFRAGWASLLPNASLKFSQLLEMQSKMLELTDPFTSDPELLPDLEEGLPCFPEPKDSSHPLA